MARAWSLFSGPGQALLSAGPGVLAFLRAHHACKNIRGSVSLPSWPLPNLLQASHAEDNAEEGSSPREDKTGLRTYPYVSPRINTWPLLTPKFARRRKYAAEQVHLA